jgi:hypothetical protein
VFEQPAVPRQQDALLFGGDPDQFRIASGISVLGVESEHAQIGRQPSQMNIERELRLAQRLRADAQLRRDVERFEYGVHRDAIAVPNQAGKVRRLAVDEHQINFRVRDAETLDHILDGGRHEELLLESLVLLVGREVVVQFGVKPNRSTSRRDDHKAFTARPSSRHTAPTNGSTSRMQAPPFTPRRPALRRRRRRLGEGRHRAATAAGPLQ